MKWNHGRFRGGRDSLLYHEGCATFQWSRDKWDPPFPATAKTLQGLPRHSYTASKCLNRKLVFKWYMDLPGWGSVFWLCGLVGLRCRGLGFQVRSVGLGNLGSSEGFRAKGSCFGAFG